MSLLPTIPTPERLVIRTARLDLLPIKREHAEAMFEVLADPALYEFTMDWPPKDVETTVKAANALPERHSVRVETWRLMIRSFQSWTYLHAQIGADPPGDAFHWRRAA